VYGLDAVRLQRLAAQHLERGLVSVDNSATRGETEALIRVLRRSGPGPAVDAAAGGDWAEGPSPGRLIEARDGLVDSVGRVAAALEPDEDEAFGPPTEEALSRHLAKRFSDPAIRTANVTLVGGGFSKQTILFDKVAGDGTSEALAMRRDFPDSPVETSVRNEFPALQDLHAAGIPVPEPVWLDEGSGDVPGPFLVSRQVAGEPMGSPATGAREDLDFDATELLGETLAAVHALPLSAMARSGLSEATWDPEALREHIVYWQERARAHSDAPLPVLEAGFDWLLENENLGVASPVVVHGDYGFHNMLVKERQFVALVDWELVHVGSAAWDLAYVRDHIQKLGTYDRFLEAYERAGGTVPGQESLDYFQVFSFLRTLTMTLVVMASFNRGELRRIPLVDVAQTIFPLQLSALADVLAGVVGASAEVPQPVE
jgi:aminoglycoside phosphotransferase (APT) family kinase protein